MVIVEGDKEKLVITSKIAKLLEEVGHIIKDDENKYRPSPKHDLKTIKFYAASLHEDHHDQPRRCLR